MLDLSFPFRVSLLSLALCAAVAACDDDTTDDPTGGGSGGAAGAGGTSTGGTGGAGGSAAPSCPSAAPATSGSCSSDGLLCSYGDELQPRCRDLLECSGGIWSEIPQGDCVPHSTADCLATVPAWGSECAPAPVGTYCDYATEATVCRCTDLECAGACEIIDPPQWRCFGPPAEGGCPATAPNVGTPCSTAGLECSYLGGACSTNGVLARCTGGLWEWPSDVPCPA
jgi:hypothetical protein